MAPNELGPTKNLVTIERPSDREVVVTRLFDAPAHLVFRAWSDPDLFKQWWLPKSMGMTLDACEMDVRTGGDYKLVFAGGMEFFGKYIEVTPPSLIKWTNEEGEDGSITTVTFTENDGKTLLVMSELFASAEAFEAEGGGGAAEATHETFAQLEELVAGLS